MAPLLEVLPVEVQVLLLCRLDSFETLFSLLRASPRLFRVYRTNRDIVYQHVVYNQITPYFIRKAIVALGLYSIAPASRTSDSMRELYQRADPSKLTMDVWKRLHRNHRIIEMMIAECVKDAFDYIRPNLSFTHELSLDPELSRSEHIRMVRGFYNRDLLASIGSRYVYVVDRMTHHPQRSIHEDRSLTTQLDVEICLNQYREFLATLKFYEFEEIIFVNEYLETRLVRYLDQAENDRFAEWKALGPYSHRYNFEDEHQWVWSGILGRPIQHQWMGGMLYGQDLATIYPIIGEVDPVTRMERLESPDMGDQNLWKPLREQFMLHRTMAVPDLAPPILPHGWRSGSPDKLDWTNIIYTEEVEAMPFGLLWGCRITGKPRPYLNKVEGMSMCGTAIWDYERFRRMGILAANNHGAIFKSSWKGQFASEIHRQGGSVERRAEEVELQWIADGLMEDRYKPWEPSPTRDGSNNIPDDLSELSE